VELLLVEGPAELVECQLVVGRDGSHGGDGAVGLLGVQVLPAHEEVLPAPELHLVDVAGMGVAGDQLLDHPDGLVVASELVEGAGLLVEDLVVVLVVRVGGQDLVVELDGLLGTRPLDVLAGREVEVVAAGLLGDLGLLGGAPLELAVGFVAGRRHRSGRCRRGLGGRRLAARALLGGGQGARLPVAEDSEALLELQVREPAHGLGRQLGFGSLLEEAPIGLHGLVEPILDADLLEVRLDRVEFGKGPAVGVADTARDERGQQEEAEDGAIHRHPQCA
jgi:hypothetical protein